MLSMHEELFTSTIHTSALRSFFTQLLNALFLNNIHLRSLPPFATNHSNSSTRFFPVLLWVSWTIHYTNVGRSFLSVLWCFKCVCDYKEPSSFVVRIAIWQAKSCVANFDDFYTNCCLTGQTVDLFLVRCPVWGCRRAAIGSPPRGAAWVGTFNTFLKCWMSPANDPNNAFNAWGTFHFNISYLCVLNALFWTHSLTYFIWNRKFLMMRSHRLLLRYGWNAMRSM
jgi:hypothetical protein